jgi:16S rRNA (adenine1518-N6/adenine1519-N6)-dimethyltransferase
MVAEPGSAAYGRLSVGLQVRFALYSRMDVPATAFKPPPKVDSAVVVMVPLGAAAPQIDNPAGFEAVVAAAFGQRRKTLRNALSALLDDSQIRAAGVDPGARAEQLAPEAFVALAEQVPNPAP